MRFMSTYASLHYHLVFSTKDRVPFIEEEWRGQLHGYLAGTIQGLGGTALQVGGVADHVHVLAGLRPSHCLADFMREVKKSSSSWVHSDIGRRKFGWQEGYAAFTVGPRGIPRVIAYIANQAEHHAKVGSKEELLSLLREAGVEIDMRYFV